MTNRSFHFAWPMAVWLVLAGTSPGSADVLCDTASFPATPVEAIHAARIGTGPRAGLVSGRGACPNETPACRQSGYVVSSDLLLTGATHGKYICAYYSNGKAETAGWLLTSRLQPQPSGRTSRDAWLGIWHYGDSLLAIKQHGRALAVSAQAYWPEKSDPNGHEGHLDAQGQPSGGNLALADPDDPRGCKLTLSMRAAYLVAHDNGLCGGANVTLSGVYQR